MRKLNAILLMSGLCLVMACNNNSSQQQTDTDTVDPKGADSVFHFVVDSTEMIPEWNNYHRVKNLLEFHTKDTMRVDSTYLATLAMGNDVSSMELQKKLGDIFEPGGSIKVRDTTQEIGLRMNATLEDKGTDDNPYFIIELIGGKSNIRTYDKNQNKMVWQWNVTPKKRGKHQLILSISRVDSINMGIGSPETRQHMITIFSADKKKSFVSSLALFFEKYWQWLLGAIALPVFLAWFTTRRKNLSKPAETGEAKSPGSNRRRKNRNR